jgi:MaoC like domain
MRASISESPIASVIELSRDGKNRNGGAIFPPPRRLDMVGDMLLALRTLYFEDLSVGMTERLSKTVASSDVVGFAEVTGDRNPIHLSEHFAARRRSERGSRTASTPRA